MIGLVPQTLELWTSIWSILLNCWSSTAFSSITVPTTIRLECRAVRGIQTKVQTFLCGRPSNPPLPFGPRIIKNVLRLHPCVMILQATCLYRLWIVIHPLYSASQHPASALVFLRPLTKGLSCHRRCTVRLSETVSLHAHLSVDSYVNVRLSLAEWRGRTEVNVIWVLLVVHCVLVSLMIF